MNVDGSGPSARESCPAGSFLSRDAKKKKNVSPDRLPGTDPVSSRARVGAGLSVRIFFAKIGNNLVRFGQQYAHFDNVDRQIRLNFVKSMKYFSPTLAAFEPNCHILGKVKRFVEYFLRTN